MARDLDALIRAAKLVEQPSAPDRERVRRGLDARLAEAVGSVPPRAGGALLSSYGGGPLVGVACAAAIGLGLLAYLSLRSAAPTAVPAHSAPAAAVSASASSIAAVAEPVPAAPEQGPAEATAGAPSLTAAAPSLPPAAPVARASTPRARAASPRAPAPLSLFEESRALAEVKRALVRADAARALALLSEQDKQFSNGALHEERAAARVLALCAAGESNAAREHAERFAKRYPASLLKARVGAACRGEGPSSAPGSGP